MQVSVQRIAVGSNARHPLQILGMDFISGELSVA